MRWGRWYAHGDREVIHIDHKIVAAAGDLMWPNTLAAFVERHKNLLDAMDVVHLMIAANEVSWEAFDFAGIGDWTDSVNRQRGLGFAPQRVANG